MLLSQFYILFWFNFYKIFEVLNLCPTQEEFGTQNHVYLQRKTSSKYSLKAVKHRMEW